MEKKAFSIPADPFLSLKYLASGHLYPYLIDKFGYCLDYCCLSHSSPEYFVGLCWSF